MGIGLSGMISGLDTDSIVKAMVSGQQLKATKIENKITLNKWTTDAWSALNTKIYSFYTKYASKLRLQSSYMTRTANSSKENVVKATANSTAAVGTHSLQINKLASSQYVTSGKLGEKDKYSKNSKLTEMGMTAGTVVTITAKKGTDDEEVKKLEVTEKTTVNDFLNACKDAGLSASFDTTQQRFFISSSQSGTEDKFAITTSALNESGVASFKKVTDLVDTTMLSGADKTKYENAMATLRQNVSVISGVLADDFKYENADATQKSVYDAIQTVKTVATEQKAEKIATDGENAVIESDIKTALAALADLDNAPTGTDEAFKVFNTSYTYDKVKELRDAAEKSLVSASDKAAQEAANKAVEALKETYGDNYVTKAQADAAQAKLDAAQKKQEELTEAQTALDEKQAEYDANYATASDADKETLQAALDEAKNKVTTLQAESDKLNAEATEAQKVVDKWNNAPADADGNILKDADGNELKALKDVYETEYNSKYVANPSEEDIVKEIRNTMVKENQTEYDAAVAAEKSIILVDSKLDTPQTVNGQTVADIIPTIENALDEASTTGNTTGTSALSALGLGEIDGSAVAGAANGMVVVESADAEFVLDGATMTETSNSFTVNGISLELISTTLNEETNKHEPVQITVGKDSDSTYKLVKEAITEYNKLIEEMNTLYNADSSRGYDPLTDEQKESMSEKDIENWEKKIKDSLLRRDDTLGSLLTGMRNALSTTYKDEDGKTYSLSSYGIVTGNYTEKGKLHIYGDEDDPLYANDADRLKAALEDDPDQVMEVLTNVFGKLYETMSEKCAKTEIRSALTFYNDKQYKNLLNDYEDDLDIMEDRIKELEDKYYKQFTAMEKAMSQLQSQQNSLASLLGTSTQ